MIHTLKDKRVLVTGASGFIGSHLIRGLVRAGCSVVGLVRPTSSLWRLEDVIEKITLIRTELGSSEHNQCKENLTEGIDIIYHLAATSWNPPLQNSIPLVQSNVLGTLELLNLALAFKVKCFVYCGSCFEYASGKMLSEDLLPHPISEYAASKSAAWLLANAFYHRYHLPVVTLRPFTIYGPFESASRLVPHAVCRALENKDIALTEGKQTRDFVYIEDMVEALLVAGVSPEAIGKTINIATGVSTSVRDITSMIVNMIGSKTTLQYGVKSYRDAEIMELSGDFSQAKEVLGWRPKFTLEEGLKRSIQWFRENRSYYSIYAKT